MNEYQKKLLQGLNRFSLEIDKLSPKDVADRIERSEHKDSFKYYAEMERIICGSQGAFFINSWEETSQSAVILD